jgi:DnaK suppressor protein
MYSIERGGGEEMSRETEIRKLREVLLKRRDALRKALAGDLGALQELRGQPDGDTLDAALDSEHQEISSQLAELESRELARIEKALQRMESGTYGICEMTGKPIPLARLRALPYATLCVEAQRELEQSGEVDGIAPDWGRILDSGSGDSPAVFKDIELT